jgi:hypothetical protein
VASDLSPHDIRITRTRRLMRYKRGPDLHGWALGPALSF